MGTPLKERTKRYRTKGRKLAHRVRAEQALGKPLPTGAQVHHVDGTMSDTSQLVICQDQGYHSLLHVRTRVVRAGGDPNTQRICTDCKQLRLITEMSRRSANSGRSVIHNQCKKCIAVRAALH